MLCFVGGDGEGGECGGGGGVGVPFAFKNVCFLLGMMPKDGAGGGGARGSTCRG